MEQQDQNRGRSRQRDAREHELGEQEGIGRGEEYGREGERERAQADTYGQEQERGAGPRGENEREDPPQSWYGAQRPPRRQGAREAGRSQRGEDHQSEEGGREQGHRGGYEEGHRGSRSGYEQDYEQLRGREARGQSYGGPGYDDTVERSRAEEPGGGSRDEARQGGRGHRGRGPRNYNRSDEKIRDEISDQLMDSDEVDPSEVEVVVEHAEVILRGTAESKEEKRRMEDIAGAVLGVREVLNHLRIRRRDESGRQEWSPQPGQGSQRDEGPQRKEGPDRGGRGSSRH